LPRTPYHRETAHLGNQLFKFLFEFAFGLAGRGFIISTYRGAFDQEHIHIFGWIGNQSIKQFAFPSMPTEITRVEKTLPVGFDENRIGVESGMVDQIGSDPERADWNWLSVFQMQNPVERQLARNELACSLKNSPSRLTDQELRPRRKAVCQTIVIRVRMRYQDAY
jgi:hypothetical protein